MRKVFKVIMIFTMLLMFNILNVDAKEISNIDELKECLSVGGLCTLISNIENSSDSVEIISSTDVALDLNGYSIVNYNFVINAGKFTLDDSSGGGKIDTFAKNGFKVNSSSLIVNSGKIIASETAIYSTRSQVTINAGEFIGKGYEENKYGTEGMVILGGNVIINGGKFKAMQDSENYGASGLIVSSNGGTPNVTINDGYFYGVDQAIKVEGGILEINNGTFEGDRYGIWISNAYINENHITTINGGEFEGDSIGIRIIGNNKSVINGGIYTGSGRGMDIQCANPICENCKNSVLLSGGRFISLNTAVNSSYTSAAIFMNSDPYAPVKISDLLDDGYELSDNNLLEKDGGVYGYYSYTESLNISISNPNLNDFDNGSDESTSTPNDSKDDEIIENPKTGSNIGYISTLTIILAVVSIISYIRIKKVSKFPKSL